MPAGLVCSLALRRGALTWGPPPAQGTPVRGARTQRQGTGAGRVWEGEWKGPYRVAAGAGSRSRTLWFRCRDRRAPAGTPRAGQ
eukprot:1183226-Prorocentrum_minimum.AAC.2